MLLGSLASNLERDVEMTDRKIEEKRYFGVTIAQEARQNREALVSVVMYDGRTRLDARMVRPLEDGSVQPTKEGLKFYSLEDAKAVVLALNEAIKETGKRGITLGKGNGQAVSKVEGKAKKGKKVKAPKGVDLSV